MKSESRSRADASDGCPSDLVALALSTFEQPVLTGGIFGSQEEDIDILVVLEDICWASFRDICAQLRRTFPLAAIYPTHRLEEFVSCKAPQGKRQKVHFLCYPSLHVFHSVERPFIRYCIAHTFKPLIGSAEVLLHDNRTRPPPDMDFYSNLLWETAQLYLMHAAPHSALQREIRRKLLYIIKFSLAETFYVPNGAIDIRRLAQTLFESPPNDYCRDGGALYRQVLAWRNPRLDTLGEVFDRIQSLLRSLQSHGS